MGKLEWRTVLYKNFKSDPSYRCTVTGHRPIYVTDVKEDIRVPLAIVNQMNTGTVSKAMLGEILSAYGLFQVPRYPLELNWCKFAHINYVVLISWGNMYTTSIVLRQWTGTKVKPVELDQCHFKTTTIQSTKTSWIYYTLVFSSVICTANHSVMHYENKVGGLHFFCITQSISCTFWQLTNRKFCFHKQFSSMYDLEITPMSVKVVWVGKHTMLSHKANLWWHL